MDILEIHAEDHLLQCLEFKPYRCMDHRLAIQFIPKAEESQFLEMITPWGDTLVAKKGDYIVSDIDKPVDRWPVDREIFEQTYVEESPGHFIKNVLIFLTPLENVTSNPDQYVKIHTLEGDVTVRAGDFFLARGVKGEVWPYPLEKVLTTLQAVN